MEPTTRSSFVRRSGLADRRNLATLVAIVAIDATKEKYFQDVCFEAGARYRGIQVGIETPTKKVETVVLFDDPRRSTLGLPVSKFSLDAVKTRLQESEAKWKQGGAL